MINNLFNYATSELSQDAFICWLLSYAHENSFNENGKPKDSALYECAVKLLKTFVPEMENSSPIITELKKQYKSIDVFVVVDDIIAIIIEDKTFTEEHSDQLSRYKATIEKEYPKLQETDKIYGVYYKTGFQSNYDLVEKAGYRVVDREKLLEIFSTCKENITNNIFIDYVESLEKFQEEADKFKELKVSDWNWYQINGFYEYLKQYIGNRYDGSEFNIVADYGYVPNQSGGMYALWIYDNQSFEYLNKEFEIYLQLEFVNQVLNICIKTNILEPDEGFQPKTLREYLVYEKIKENKSLKEYGFKKPSRYGSGKTMTIGVFDSINNTCEDALRNSVAAIESYLEYNTDLGKHLGVNK